MDDEKKERREREEKLYKKLVVGDKGFGRYYIEGDTLEVYEKVSFIYGAFLSFREELTKDLKTYNKLLSDNEKLFTEHGVKDPMPEDYKDVKRALVKCHNTLKDPFATLKDIRKALDEFQDKAYTYAGNHREFWRSHRSEESAQRHVIINGIRDLCIVHKALFDDFTKKMQNGLRRVHKDLEDYQIGKETVETLKNAVQGQGYYRTELIEKSDLKRDLKIIAHYSDKKIESGKAKYPETKLKNEQKMLFDRYARKNGLNTPAKRNALKPLKGWYIMEDYAKNYLSIKYLKAIKERQGIKGFIAVNEAIREKTFKKEVSSLEYDFYFKRIVNQYNDTDWVKKWSKIEKKSEKILKNLKTEARDIQNGINNTMAELQAQKNPSAPNIDNMNEKEVPGMVESEWDKVLKPYIPVAKLLLCKTLTRPENRPMLHAYADAHKVLQARIIRDCADYLYRTEKMPNDENKIRQYLEAGVKDTGLHKRLGLRIQNYFEAVVFPVWDEMAKNNNNIILNEDLKNPTIQNEDNNEIKTNSESDGSKTNTKSDGNKANTKPSSMGMN